VLEQYDTYHTRYLALDCPSKHNTSFFDQCCHPLLANQSPDTLPAECDLNGGDDTCDGDDDPATTPVSSPTTTEQDTPTTSPTPATPHTSASPPPVSTPAPGPGTDDNTGGVATFFYQGGNAGACGTVHSDSDFVAALDSARYNNGEFCGKQVTITNTQNQKSVTVTVADECPTCENGNSIDLSVAAFDAIGSESQGVLPIEWHFDN
jgi:hypothetical protein